MGVAEDRPQPAGGRERDRALVWSALDGLGDGVLCVERGGRIVFWNAAFAVLGGYPPGMLESRDGARAFAFLAAQLEPPASGYIVVASA